MENDIIIIPEFDGSKRLIMPRRKRQWHPNGYFHVIMRGNNRQRIFRTAQDMNHLLRAIDYARDFYPFTLLAYCIMNNHYHLLIRSPEVPLHKIMARINRRYSDYYSKKYHHVGRIYEKRYYSKEAYGPHAVLAVSSYIHRNPIDTKVPMVENLADYPYSSFPLYSSPGGVPPKWMDLELLPTLLPGGIDKTSTAYSMYCLLYRQQIEEDKKIQLLLSDDAYL